MFHGFILALSFVVALYVTFLAGQPLSQAQNAETATLATTADYGPVAVTLEAVEVLPPASNLFDSVLQGLISLKAAIEEIEALAPDCERSDSHPLYCIYTVKSGDTLSAISKLFQMEASGGLSAVALLAESNKPDVSDSDQIVPGQRLRIPLQRGVLHTVLGAETLSDLARRYGVTSEAIASVAENKIAGSGTLLIGQEILIPDPVQNVAPIVAPPPTPVPPATPTPEPTSAIQATATTVQATALPPAIQTAIATVRGRTPSPGATGTPRNTPRPGALFIWPANGPISSYYGPSHPLGIDIDFFSNPNQPVVAAAAGTVVFAGGNPCCSYGYYIVIDHGNGFTTLYAHFSSMSVSAGQKVTPGQLIGLGGNTGYATGYHLHFEIRYNGAVINPIDYLP